MERLNNTGLKVIQKPGKSEKHALTSTESILLSMQMEHSCSLSHQVRSSEAAKEKLRVPVRSVNKGGMVITIFSY